MQQRRGRNFSLGMPEDAIPRPRQIDWTFLLNEVRKLDLKQLENLEIEDQIKAIELKEKEVLGEDGDCLILVCKTDADHMLGYVFNNMFCLWKCNHQGNQWFYQIRLRVNNWLHPYYNAKYGNENGKS